MAVDLNAQEIHELVSAVEDYCSELSTRFIKPAAESLRNCGFKGKYKKEIEETAQQLLDTLTDVNKQLAEVTGDPEGSVLDALRALEKEILERVEASAFHGVGASLEDSKTAKVQVEISRSTMKPSVITRRSWSRCRFPAVPKMPFLQSNQYTRQETLRRSTLHILIA